MRRISPSAEAELLLTSIDVASQPAEKTARIRQIVGRGLDWNSLVRRASAHRLVGLLSRTLEGEAGALGIPLEAFAALRLHRLSHAAYADRSISQLAVLMNDFHRAGVAALILKGPALSLQAYGDIATRDFSDIDLLVRRSEVVAAADVLARAGFRARTYDRNAFAAGFFRNTSDAFCSADDACLIDLHWKIGDWYFPFGLDRSKRRPQTVVDGHQFESLNLFSGQYKGREMQGIQCAERFPKGNLASPLAYRGRQLPKLTARPYGADLAVRVGKPRFTDLAHLSQAVKCARRFD